MSNTIGVSCEESCFSLADALALYFIQSVESFAGYRVVNVESEEQMAQCDVLIGVGDTYDASKGRFSHYERDHTATMASLCLLPEHSTIMSSAGLVYASYGPRLLREKFHADTRDGGEEGSFRRAYRRLYEYFVEVVDCLAFGAVIPNSTQEKEALSDQLGQMEEELMAKAAKSQPAEFLQLVVDYSAAVGKLFEQTAEWYFGPFTGTYKAMRDAVRKAEQSQLTANTEIHLPDVINRVVKDEEIDFDYRPQLFVVKDPSVTIGEGGDEKYRVRCHHYPDQLDDSSVAFPDEWVYGWRDHVPEMGPHLEFIHTDQLYAVVKGRLPAIHLARRLVDWWMEREPTPYDGQNVTNGANENGTAEITNGVQKLTNGLFAIQLASHEEEVTADEDEEPIHYEYCFEVMSANTEQTSQGTQSQYETVSVWLAEGAASLAVLESALLDEYHLKWPDYHLCHRPGSSNEKEGAVPVRSSEVTESSDFWDATAYTNGIVYAYAIPSPQAMSESVNQQSPSPTEKPSTIHQKWNIDPASTRIGFNAASKWGVAELLACAVMKSAMDGKHKTNAELVSFSKAKPGASYAVKIGEMGAYCFEDVKHSYDGSNRVSQATLDLGKGVERLSCAGIAFALHGRQSIKHILAPIMAKSTPAEKSKFNSCAVTAIHRRIHTRLMKAIDAVVEAGDSQPFYSTPESDALVAALKSAYSLASDTAEEVEAKFYLAEAITAGYYYDAVYLVWRHYCTAPPTQ